MKLSAGLCDVLQGVNEEVVRTFGRDWESANERNVWPLDRGAARKHAVAFGAHAYAACVRRAAGRDAAPCDGACQPSLPLWYLPNEFGVSMREF